MLNEFGPRIDKNIITTYTRESAAEACVLLNLTSPLAYFDELGFDRYGEIIIIDSDTRRQVVFPINRSSEFDGVLPDDPASWNEEHHRVALRMYGDALLDLDDPYLVEFGQYVVELDVDENSHQPTHTFKRIYNRPLRFTGERIAHAVSKPERMIPEFPGSVVVHRREVSLYLTIGGNYVCLVREYGVWDGDFDSQYARFFTNGADVAAYLADDPLVSCLRCEAFLPYLAPTVWY